MRFLLLLPALFCAGFLWTLGSDMARRVIVRRTKPLERPQRTSAGYAALERALEEADDEWAGVRVHYFAGFDREERWTVQ